MGWLDQLPYRASPRAPHWTAHLPARMLPLLVCSRRARDAAHGMVTVRRAWEYVLVNAVIEGASPERGAYYDGYVEALGILGARAAWIARAL